MYISSRSIYRVAGPLIFPVLLMVGGCSNPTDAEKAAMPIVEKNVAARGGLEAWQKTTSMVMSGQMDAGKVRSPESIRASMQAMKPNRGPVVVGNAAAHQAKNDAPQDEKQVQLPFVMELQRPRKMRLELTFQGQNAVQVFDGKNGWKLRPFLNRNEVEAFTPEEMKLASDQQELDGPLIDYQRKGNKVELEGADSVEGRDAYRLKVTLPNGDVRHVWVDKETYLDVKIDGTRKMDGKPRPMSTYYRDYKFVNGLNVPHTLETRVEGVRGSEKIAIEQVKINPKLDDARFSKPLL